MSDLVSGYRVLNSFSCSTQLSTNCIMLINVKMPTIVGILTFINMINTKSENLKGEKSLFFSILVLECSLTKISGFTHDVR